VGAGVSGGCPTEETLKDFRQDINEIGWTDDGERVIMANMRRRAGDAGSLIESCDNDARDFCPNPERQAFWKSNNLYPRNECRETGKFPLCRPGGMEGVVR
jgi:hypothetical protein